MSVYHVVLAVSGTESYKVTADSAEEAENKALIGEADERLDSDIDQGSVISSELWPED
jgi:hypothetical protein